MQLYSQVEQEIYIRKKGTLDFPIKEIKFYSLDKENSLKLSKQGNDMMKTTLSVLVFLSVHIFYFTF